MKIAMVAGIGALVFAGSTLAADKYKSPTPSSSSSRAVSRPAATPSRQQEYKRQDRANDNRRQDTYRAQQNRAVNDQIKKQNDEKSRRDAQQRYYDQKKKAGSK